jgi:hypothetical protein
MVPDKPEQGEHSYTSLQFAELLVESASNMATDEPGATPEGLLIKRVRESLRPRVTVAEAAKRAEISAEMWGHIERGHRSAGRDAGRVQVRARAATLARMAFEVGASAQALKEAGRVDAAEVLTQMQSRDLEVENVEVGPARVFFAVRPGLPEEDREAVRRWAEEIAEKMYQARNKDLDS